MELLKTAETVNGIRYSAQSSEYKTSNYPRCIEGTQCGRISHARYEVTPMGSKQRSFNVDL